MAHKAKFIKAAETTNLPPALLAAIASRESRGGAVLDARGRGDGGNAFGIMQIDFRFHRPEVEDGPTGEAHILQAAEILQEKLKGVQRQFESLTDSSDLQTAVSRYNGGAGHAAPNSDQGTTGGDYCNDVWARARFYARVENW
jgi:soluble lytic murein transglycosylase-like protein